jgi:2-dehydro-3-deoxyphosphooctonate aldolase (KDO 8-P synthase)
VDVHNARRASVGEITIGEGLVLALVAGPCVIEDLQMTMRIAETTKAVARRLGCPLIFKASFDKANRSSGSSFRGPGLVEGLKILGKVKQQVGVPVLSDVHETSQVSPAAEVLDVIQIPAFLCRQTDLLEAAARTGRCVNVKKGQFMAPWDMRNVVMKLREAGCENILLTERGTSFGYNRLVSDMTAIPLMQETGCPVLFDATHSVQLPGAQGTRSGGSRAMIPFLARAAVAAGADGVFVEVHMDPDKAASDAATQLAAHELEPLLIELAEIRSVVLRHESSSPRDRGAPRTVE